MVPCEFQTNEDNIAKIPKIKISEGEDKREEKKKIYLIIYL